MKMPVFTNTLAFRISSLFLLMLFISGAGFWLWLSGSNITGDYAADEEHWYDEVAEGELDELALELTPLLGNLEELTQRVVAYGQIVGIYDAEVLVFDPTGQYVSSSQPDSLSQAVPNLAVQLMHDMSAGDWDYGSYPLPEDVDAYENRIFEVDRMHQDGDSNKPLTGYLVASYSPVIISVGDIKTAERKIGYNAVALLLAYSGLSGLVIMFWTTRRVRRLSDGVAAFTAGDFTTRVPSSSGDEIGALGRHFNSMARNISSMMDKLRDKEQFQKQLIANVSHDLRTPMASMRGYVETLSLQAETMTPADRERYLAIITGNLVHLDKLIDHMLVLSRFDSGQATFQMEDFPLIELTDSVMARCEGMAQDRNIELELDVDDSDTFVHADPLQIAQVLQNLIENAIKYNNDGGRVSVILRGGGPLVEVKVVDTGMGISAEDLPHIFKRFFTADKSRTRTVVGSGLSTAHAHLGQSSGLGLAIASKIVAGHNSMLQVESRLEEGTSFSFMLKSATDQVELEQEART